MTDQEDTQAQGTEDTDDLDLTVPDEDTDVGQMQEDLAALRAQVAQLKAAQAAQETGGADPEVMEAALLELAPGARHFKEKRDGERQDRENMAKLREARRAEEGRTLASPQIAEKKKKAERARQEAQKIAKEHGLLSEESKHAESKAIAAETEARVATMREETANEVERRSGERPETSPVPEIDPNTYLQRGDQERKGLSVVEDDASLAMQLEKARRGQ